MTTTSPTKPSTRGGESRPTSMFTRVNLDVRSIEIRAKAQIIGKKGGAMCAVRTLPRRHPSFIYSA